jgi:hypothetical protein
MTSAIASFQTFAAARVSAAVDAGAIEPHERDGKARPELLWNCIMLLVVTTRIRLPFRIAPRIR